jgi:hypothetical protein
MTVRFSGTDDPDRVFHVNMDDDKKAIPVRAPEKDKSLLVIRMIGVGDGARQRVGKGAHRLVKGYSMLLQIDPCLGRIPPEGDGHLRIL